MVCRQEELELLNRQLSEESVMHQSAMEGKLDFMQAIQVSIAERAETETSNASVNSTWADLVARLQDQKAQAEEKRAKLQQLRNDFDEMQRSLGPLEVCSDAIIRTHAQRNTKTYKQAHTLKHDINEDTSVRTHTSTCAQGHLRSVCL